MTDLDWQFSDTAEPFRTERHEQPFNPNWRIWQFIDVYDEAGDCARQEPILMKPCQVGEGWFDFERNVQHDEIWTEWVPADDNPPDVLEAYRENVDAQAEYEAMLRDMDDAMGRR